VRKVRDVLPRAIDNDQALDAMRAQRILRRWPEVVGEKLASKCRPDRYTRGTVWVAVSSSSWAQELRMMRDDILGRLRAISDEPKLFTELRFGVRSLPPPPEAEPEAEVLLEVEIPADRRALSIREIAARRRATWRDGDGA